MTIQSILISKIQSTHLNSHLMKTFSYRDGAMSSVKEIAW